MSTALRSCSAVDDLAKQWCCLTCSHRFPFGAARLRPHSLHCPRCTSTDLHPATGEVVVLTAYHGPIGTKH